MYWHYVIDDIDYSKIVETVHVLFRITSDIEELVEYRTLALNEINVH